MQRILLVAFLMVVFFSKAISQNPLPDFSVEDFGNNKVRISWVNPFNENCIQLSVQSSLDNTKGFKTIFSTESPQLPQNGFIYTMPFQSKFYYRIFYILNGNAFFFTPAKSAGATATQMQGEEEKVLSGDATRIITIRDRNDSIIALVPYTDFKKFRDSVLVNTKDTLFILSQNDVLLKPYNPTNVYRPSTYVVSNRDGFVEIKLPEATSKNYKIIFFEGDGKKLFTINKVTDTDLVVDKSNFLHAGWFIFELYENDKLKERNKILLQKDF